MTENHNPAQDGGVIFSFHQVGAYTKVTAMDVASMTEVAIVADSKASQERMRHITLEKLRKVLAKEDVVGVY
jgi:hypothetical protein